jgi:hypothetical protein
MNKEQQELLDEAYKKYCESFNTQTLIEQLSFDTGPMTQSMFIGRCKFVTEFSEHWGLRIEERELSLEERMNYWFHNSKPNRDVCDYVDELEATLKSKELDKSDVPSRLITVTYNDKTIESYD